MVSFSVFFEVTLYSVHVYGRGTLCCGTHQYFLLGHTLLHSCQWERDALLWYASVLSSRSHFTPCMSMNIWLVVGGSGVSPYELVWVAFGTNADLLPSLIHPWSPYPHSHIIIINGSERITSQPSVGWC